MDLFSLTSFILMFLFFSNLLAILHQLVHDVRKIWYKRGHLAWNGLTFLVLSNEGHPFPIFILYPVKPVKVWFFSLQLKFYTAQKMKFSIKDFFIFCALLLATCCPMWTCLLSRFPNNTIDFWTIPFKLTLL